MAISHITKIFAAKDAKVAKMTADPAGGSATYGTLIDVPGIKSVTIGGDINTVELRGDHSLLDSDSVLNNITVSFEFAKQNLDLLVGVLGGATADTGTGSTEVATWSLLGTDTLFPNFKFEAQCVSADTVGGDVHLVLYKCRLSEFPSIGLAEEDYETFSISATASPRNADSKWIDVVLNETAAAIA